MRRGVFVTGTDTGIGKTVTCAALLCRYRQTVPLRYWKPIQTGIEQDDDTAEVRRLASCRDEEFVGEGIRLPHPVSPHLAARWSGRTITVSDIVESYKGLEPCIVEGAGGALVPLNDTEMMIDLMRALALPVLVVARSSLGTINHTLLTLEALRARSLCVSGVVMVGLPNPDNRTSVEQYGGVPVLGEMPAWTPLEPAALHEWATREFDPQTRLLELLR
jgi:dethiobiotin synthetase